MNENSERNILRLKWFNTIQDIVDTYNNTENLKKLLTTLNKILGLTTKNSIIFSVTVTRKILGIHYTYHLCVNIIVIVPDPQLITVQDFYLLWKFTSHGFWRIIYSAKWILKFLNLNKITEPRRKRNSLIHMNVQ